MTGFDLVNQGITVSNVGTLIVTLKPWDERKTPDLQLGAILHRFQQRLGQEPGAIGFATGLPPILGLANQGGFEFQLLDLRDQGALELARVADELAAAARQRPELVNVFSNFQVNTPALTLRFDREKARTLGIPDTDVYDSLQTYLGGFYVNLFNRFGRTWQVLVQAEADFRRTPEDIGSFYVRGQGSLMVPLSTLVSTSPTSAPDTIYRYDRRRTAKITGGPSPGHSAGEAVAAMEDVAAKTLPAGYSYAWTGTVLPAEASRGHGADRLRALLGDGAPAPGGALRELGDPVRRHPGRAPRHLRRARGRLPPGPSLRRLHADRHRHPDRARREERHPDRRVRPAPAGGGAIHPGGGHRGRPRPSPSRSS